MVLICGYGDTRHLFSISQSSIVRGRGLSQRGHLASCDLWRSHVRMKNKASVSVANETSMHWENSGPKQAAWTQNKSPPSTHTHITPFKPIYKHYLYFVHTLVHAHTHSHWASSSWVTLAFQIYIIKNGLCCCYWKSMLFFPLVRWRFKGTAHDSRLSFYWSICWDCQSLNLSSSSSSSSCPVSRGPTRASVSSRPDSRCGSPHGMITCRLSEDMHKHKCVYLIILEPHHWSPGGFKCGGRISRWVKCAEQNNRLEVFVFLTALLWKWWTCCIQQLDLRSFT